MKIQYVKGDLLETDVDVIVHGCNGHGVMGSGVAKAIRKKYPQAYQDYRDAYLAHYNLQLEPLPTAMIIPVETKGKIIINAITQSDYGNDGRRYVSYDAIAAVMSRLEFADIGQVAMPQIGAGLGGGDWNVIEAIIESELKTTQAYVYTL